MDGIAGATGFESKETKYSVAECGPNARVYRCLKWNSHQLSEWLPWLGRVRFLIITFLVMVVIAVRQLTPIQIPVHTLFPLVVLWYTLAVVYV